MVMQAIGSIANLGSSIFGGSNAARAAKEQYEYNRQLQQQAQEWQEYAAKNKWQWETESKENAGINKLYGLGSASVPTATSGSTGQADYVGEQNNKANQVLQGIQLGQDFAAKKAQIKLQQQQTKTEEVNTNLKAIEKINAELETIYRKKELSYQDKKLKAELEETKSRIAKNIADTSKSYEEAGTARAKTAQENEITEGIRRTNKWHKDNPTASGFAIGAKEGGGGYTGLGVGVADLINKGGRTVGFSQRDRQKQANYIKEKTRSYSVRGRIR